MFTNLSGICGLQVWWTVELWKVISWCELSLTQLAQGARVVLPLCGCCATIFRVVLLGQGQSVQETCGGRWGDLPTGHLWHSWAGGGVQCHERRSVHEVSRNVFGANLLKVPWSLLWSSWRSRWEGVGCNRISLLYEDQMWLLRWSACWRKWGLGRADGKEEISEALSLRNGLLELDSDWVWGAHQGVNVGLPDWHIFPLTLWRVSSVNTPVVKAKIA